MEDAPLTKYLGLKLSSKFIATFYCHRIFSMYGREWFVFCLISILYYSPNLVPVSSMLYYRNRVYYQSSNLGLIRRRTAFHLDHLFTLKPMFRGRTVEYQGQEDLGNAHIVIVRGGTETPSREYLGSI